MRSLRGDMVFKLFIMILMFINLPINLDAKDFPYSTYSVTTISNMSLQKLVIHRAEVYAFRGYKFKNDFIRQEMAKRSWYNPFKKFNEKQFTKNEKKYISILSDQIEKLKEKELKLLTTRLERYLGNRMEVKFSHLQDLDSDGYFDLLAVCGKKFPISEKSLTDEASYHYYGNYNELYLIAIGKNFYSQVKLSHEVKGRAEFVNKFHSDYYLNNGKPQIEVIIHSLPVVNSKYGPHKQKLYIFNLESGKLRKIFDHQIYTSFAQGSEEKITQFEYSFDNLVGDEQNELTLVKYLIKRIYKKADSVKKSHSDNKIKMQSLYYEYDRSSRSYRKFNLNYRKNKN